MVGVVNIEKLEKIFMDHVYQKMEQELSNCADYVKSHDMKLQDYLRGSWGNCLREMGVKYQTLQNSGITGNPAYVYLSFLWSGVLGQGNWYRVDYYDSRDCISDVECGEGLDISPALKCFKHSSNVIIDLFASQTKVKPYIADEIVYKMAERFCIELKPLLLKTLYQVLLGEGDKLYGESSVKFFMGEFLSNTEPIAEWRRGKLISPDVKL